VRTQLRLLAAAGVFALALSAPSSAYSQTRKPGDPAGEGLSPAERQMLVTYRLSMDKLNRVADATRKFHDLEKRNPGLGKSLERKADENKSLSSKIAQIEKVPEVRATLASAGLTGRDYMLTLINAMNAGAAVQIKKMGGDASSLPVSPQNIQFYRTNQAAIEKLSKQIKDETKAAESAQGESTPADSESN
jgi:hypothetical protein